jgi:hypothetical protein
MKVYIVAATLGQYQDALRALGLHERAAVHLIELPEAPVDGPVYVYSSGWIKPLHETRRAA